MFKNKFKNVFKLNFIFDIMNSLLMWQLTNFLF